MGSRDYRHRETKKPRKSTRKLPETSILAPPTMVEVVGKGKKARKEEEVEEEKED